MSDLLEISAQGVLVCSHFKSATEMDAHSKFLYSLEQKNGHKSFIHAVRTESGDLWTEPTESRRQTISFYLSRASSWAYQSSLSWTSWSSPKHGEWTSARYRRPPCRVLQGILDSNRVGCARCPTGQHEHCSAPILTLLLKKEDPTDLKNGRPVSLLCTASWSQKH